MDASPYRVLLVEDNPGDARLIQEYLAESTDASYDIVAADRLAAGLERLAQGGVDVVLLDLTLPDSQGLGTFQKLRDQAPDVPVIVLSGLDDAELADRAVREGAQDYLIKGQVSSRSLGRAIRFAIERHRMRARQASQRRPVRAGRVIGFLGAKGGVGTTTVALNVASALSRQDTGVVAVELRPWHGSFSCQLNQVPVFSLAHLLDVPAERLDEREVAARLHTSKGGLQILFGPQKTGDFKEIDVPRVEALVTALAGMADFVVLDLPCVPSAANGAAVRHCHAVAVVAEQEPVSVLSARTTLDLLKAWGAGAVSVVLVRRARLASVMRVDEIKGLLGAGFPVLGVVPYAADELVMAQKLGAPLVLAEPAHPASQILREIAGQLGVSRAGAARLQ